MTAFLAKQILFGASQTIATGYLGRVPDKNSSFMRESSWNFFKYEVATKPAFNPEFPNAKLGVLSDRLPCAD